MGPRLGGWGGWRLPLLLGWILASWLQGRKAGRRHPPAPRNSQPPRKQQATCPNCAEVNTTYFGAILGVDGNRDQSVVKCPCCESQLTFDAKQRQVSVTELAS